jgi:hypothetical protein
MAGLLGGGLLLGEWGLLAWAAWAILLLRRPGALRGVIVWAPLVLGGLAMPLIVDVQEHVALFHQWARQAVVAKTGTHVIVAVVAVTLGALELLPRRWREPVEAWPGRAHASRQSVLIVVLALLWIPHGVSALRHLAAGSLSNLPPQEQAYRSVQRWCAEHTPQDALFLVPPRPEGFRSFSHRSIYCDWKDFALWSPGFERIWWDRMTSQVGTDFLNEHGTPDLETVNRLYGELPPERVLELARESGATYIVREGRYPLPFACVYRNEHYLVYRLPGDRTEGAAADRPS